MCNPGENCSVGQKKRARWSIMSWCGAHWELIYYPESCSLHMLTGRSQAGSHPAATYSKEPLPEAWCSRNYGDYHESPPLPLRQALSSERNSHLLLPQLKVPLFSTVNRLFQAANLLGPLKLKDAWGWPEWKEGVFPAYVHKIKPPSTHPHLFFSSPLTCGDRYNT
jgi:hypothetical protein